MKRRRFLGGGAGLAGILAAGMAPAVHAAQSTRWRLVSRFPKTMDVAHEGMQHFTRRLKEMSGGKFEIAIVGTDELSGNPSVLESVQRGSIECGHTSASYYVHKDEAFALDNAIPFGLNVRQLNAWMQYGNGLNLLREFYRSHGVINFPMGNTGAQMGGWYRKPIHSLAGLKNLRIRITGLAGRIFENLGGKVSAQSSNETFNALQRGSLDAAEWSSAHDDLQLGLHDVCPYYAYPGWGKGSSQFSLYINLRAYDALTDENQALIEAAAAATHQSIQAQYDTKNAAALEQLVATGTRLVVMPKTILDAAWKNSQELYADLAGKNPWWRKIHGSYASFLQEKVWGWGHAEVSFDQYMHEQMVKAAAKRPRKKSAPAARR